MREKWGKKRKDGKIKRERKKGEKGSKKKREMKEEEKGAERRESLKGERRKIGKEKKNLRTRPGGRG